MVDRRDKRAGWYFRTKLPKRTFPKNHTAEFIRTPRIDHNKAAAYNAQRTRATLGSRGNTSHDPDSGFMSPVPRTRSLSSFDPATRKQVRSERGLVVDKRQEIIKREKSDLFELYLIWQGDRHQGVTLFNQKILRKQDNYKLLLCFNGNEFLFVCERGDERMISRVYIGREEAYGALNNNFIAWRLKQSISQTRK